jgi:uncharacterized protein YukJ
VETDDDNPHFHIRVAAGARHYRVAVNIQSTDHTGLLYLAIEAFQHPVTQLLERMPRGFSAVERKAGGLALDFVRCRLFERRSMSIVPARLAGPNNDLNEYLVRYVGDAQRDEAAQIYALGEPWGPEPNTRDKIFGFRPGNGLHNVHMNQGNDARHRGEDGLWQDGALFIQLPTQARWVAIFLAFQSQSWKTDGRGHAPRTT